MQPTIEPSDAQYLIALAMSKHDDDSGHVLVNIGTAKVPEGMRVESIGPHRFVAMRDLAYYGAHGRVREEPTTGSEFYIEARTGARVWVTERRVRIERSTHTSNPHQPAKKWFQTAKPVDSAAYAARKLASGEWVR